MEQTITVVNGPPGAGKTTYVRANMKPGDIVIDVDYLASALSLCDVHHAPEGLLVYALALRDCMAAKLIERPARAWWITSEPDPSEVQRIAAVLCGARVVTLDTPMQTCLDRVSTRPERVRQAVRNWYVARLGHAG